MDDNACHHIKMAVYQELQDALKLKQVNEELLEYLTSSLRWLIHYTNKNKIALPELDKIDQILNTAMDIANKLPSGLPPTRNQHDFKHGEDSTEPYPINPSKTGV